MFSPVFLQGLQKGSAPHSAGSNGNGSLSHPQMPDSTALPLPHNQVGHSASAASPRQQTLNHLPSPPALPHAATSGGATSGAPATKESTNNNPAMATASLGNGASEGQTPPSANSVGPQAEGLPNHVHSGDGGQAGEAGEKQSLSIDNPRLSALLARGKGPEEGGGNSEGGTARAAASSATPEPHKKINNIHPAALPSTPHAQGSSAASSPISAMSTATPSPKSSEHTQTGAHSPAAASGSQPAPAVNGNGKGGISEDSQSPLKAEPPAVAPCLKATPPHPCSSSSSSSSSSISIYPSSTDVLKACR